MTTSPSQTSKYLQSPLRDVGEVPLSPYLFSPGALPHEDVFSTGNEHGSAPLVAISPGILSPGAKLLKKRYGGMASGMSSPERMILPGFQQSTVFEAGQSVWEAHGRPEGGMPTFRGRDPQSKSLWGNDIRQGTPQEYSSNKLSNYAAVTVSDKRKSSSNSGSSSAGRSTQRSRSTYREGGRESTSSSRPHSGNRKSTYSHALVGKNVSPGISSEGQSPRGVLDMGDSPVRVSRCNCKKSRCLKLYCECFTNLRYCNDCNCLDCNNTKDFDHIRNDAIKTTKERNSSAFTSKVTSNKAHATGCHCKNSLCLKKYCECFQAGAHCGVNCKCLSCQNFEGSIALANIKNSDRGGDKKRKGSPTTTVFNNVSANNTPEDTHGNSNKVAKLDSAAEMNRDPAKKTSTPPSAQPVGRVTRGSVNRNKPKPVKTEPQDEEQCPSLHKEARLGRGERETMSLRSRAKKNRGRHGTPPPPLAYPFFGNSRPPCSKLVALNVLDNLSNKDIFSMSLVSTYWARASMDEALWSAES